MRADNALAVGAARALGLVRSDDWPLIAAHLLAEGADGPDLAELASMSRGASGWAVDRVLESALAEAGIPSVEVERAGEVVARSLAQAIRRGGKSRDHVIIRALAELGPYDGYPGGVIAEAYYASEWLDCECHRVSAERDAAHELETRLEALPDLDANDALIQALFLHIVESPGAAEPP